MATAAWEVGKEAGGESCAVPPSCAVLPARPRLARSPASCAPKSNAGLKRDGEKHQAVLKHKPPGAVNHTRNNVLLRNGEDLVDAVADDRPGDVAQARAQTVGNRGCIQESVASSR